MNITIEYIPSVYKWIVREWGLECTHETTYKDVIEHYDHYMDAVTGQPQSLKYEPLEVCEQCNAHYSLWDEEWFND